jgi:hypothetical protein
VAPTRTLAPILADEVVVDRRIRVAPEPDTGWRQAVFVGDNTLREPPMRLLPCRLLEMAEAAGSGQFWRVSGEVTRYKGRHYLLIRKLIRLRDMGQF